MFCRIAKLKPDYFIKLAKLLWLNLTDNGIDTFDARVFGRNQLLGKISVAAVKCQQFDFIYVPIRSWAP
jgi:hypothetical protein